MSNINNAIYEVNKLEELASQDKIINNLHPLAKMLVTVLYICIIVSFNGYQLTGLCGMVLYLIVLFVVGEISFKDSLRRLRIVLPLVCFVGVFNPIFDREIIMYVGDIAVSSGFLSMITLIIKGIFTILAGYLLIVTTSIEKICYSLRMIHVPKLLVTVIMLIYRYISLLLSEVRRLTAAYSLRAPKQKGINIKAWGPLVGQLLLRSMDRAENVYDSMCMRGFDGEFYWGRRIKITVKDIIYVVVMAVFFIGNRIYPLFNLVGGLF